MTDVPLGIVATGTGNDIARHFGLPSRDAAASAHLIDQALSGEGAITAIDAIYASRPDGALLAPQHRWSLAVVSAGLDATVNARANALTWPAHEGRYVRALIAELVAMAPYGYRVTTAAVWTWRPRPIRLMACWRSCAWIPWAEPAWSLCSAGCPAVLT